MFKSDVLGRFPSRVSSANVEGKEKWLGYLLGPAGALLLNVEKDIEKKQQEILKRKGGIKE